MKLIQANETRHTEWRETCKCKCRLDASVFNYKQVWNDDKCRCECKELIDKGECDKGSIWNPCNCECECDKSCDVSEYLDYKNCKCRKKLVDKLVPECNENIDEVKIVESISIECNSIECNSVENIHKCSSSTFVHCVVFNNIYNQYRNC